MREFQINNDFLNFIKDGRKDYLIVKEQNLRGWNKVYDLENKNHLFLRLDDPVKLSKDTLLEFFKESNNIVYQKEYNFLNKYAKKGEKLYYYKIIEKDEIFCLNGIKF